MKQRLGIAAAIMHSPELLILDEPINGLDPFGIKEIRTLLKRLAHEFGITILISSHILSEIENIADVIGVMDNGKLITELTKEELHEQLNKNVEFEVSDIDKATTILEDMGLHKITDYNIVESNTIFLYTNINLRDKINEIFVKNDIRVKKMNLNEENLEEYFTRIINPIELIA
jgi:ABC-2 type transport system ATP-binding protein/bacitracin transport system ATP-binding protein